MSKRDQLRERQKKLRLRNRIITIVMVVAGAALVVFVMVIPGIKATQAAMATKTASSQLTVITPVVRKAAMNGTSLGDPNAKVKLDVWEDFQCSGCKSYADTIEPSIVQAYVDTGKVYYTFHNAPFIDGGQGESQNSANAAMCANAQGRFWDFHDMLFANWNGENQGIFTDTRMTAIAQTLGLDMTAFNQCYQAKTYAQEIKADYAAGQKLGVPPTPGIFLNGTKLVSSKGENYIPSVEDISAAIEAALGNE